QPKPKAKPTEISQESSGQRGNTLDEKVSRWLKDVFGKELKLTDSEITEKASIADYGVDSILITQLQRHISKLIGKDADPSLLYEYDSIAQLTQWLVKNHAAVVSAKLTSNDKHTADYSANENSTKKQSSVNPVETHERSTKEPIDIDISRHQYGKT